MLSSWLQWFSNRWRSRIGGYLIRDALRDLIIAQFTNNETPRYLADIIREILENRARTYRQLGEDYDAYKEKRIPSEDLEEEERLDEGGVDTNFINYESPAIDNGDVI